MKLLEIVNEIEVEKYKKTLLDIRLDEDDVYKHFASGMIDLFPRILTLEEVEQQNFDFRDLNLKNEHKYVDLFYTLFNMTQKSKLVVQMDYKALKDYEHLNILEELDRYEKHLWVNQMLHLNNAEVTDYFLVDDFDLLKMLVQINIREQAFMLFHFIDLEVVVRGSFDCSMSIYSKNRESIENLRPLVERFGLHIRAFEVGEDT
ncbi:hypothetical protein [Fusibacter ferrireducens]|uniref:Uncharacterized protein n=1 Tax=Fusibacter ferrireducens TaxID=2785058 RepID=A0ABR9ZQ04_9FIRM|nr:hypothetical protein [Fusibacter ferrireducens]MBF4692010.1 hypothetical protein [Fusibacter ferrireducens]